MDDILCARLIKLDVREGEGGWCLFPEKIIQTASVFNAVVKRLSLHLRGKNCICDFYADYYVDGL